jgi:hypothetical protein
LKGGAKMTAEKFEIVVVPLTDDNKWPDAPNWIGVAKGDGGLLTYVLVPFDLVSMIRGDDEDRAAEVSGGATVNVLQQGQPEKTADTVVGNQ